VLGLCIGSALVLLALVRTGLLSWPSPGAVALGVWSVALVVIVAFEKTNRAVGPSVGGVIHRYASLVAFLSVPVAALLLGRRWRGDATWGRFATVSRILGVLALVVLGAIVARIALRRVPGVSEMVPLGLGERVLAIIEVATVALLALWSLRPVTAISPRPPEKKPAPVTLSRCGPLIEEWSSWEQGSAAPPSRSGYSSSLGNPCR
jgi:hypothetical protein